MGFDVCARRVCWRRTDVDRPDLAIQLEMVSGLQRHLRRIQIDHRIAGQTGDIEGVQARHTTRGQLRRNSRAARCHRKRFEVARLLQTLHRILQSRQLALERAQSRNAHLRALDLLAQDIERLALNFHQLADDARHIQAAAGDFAGVDGGHKEAQAFWFTSTLPYFSSVRAKRSSSSPGMRRITSPVWASITLAMM